MNRSVLVVDDEPLLRWACYEGLKDCFAVVTANSVEHAMSILATMQVDAVVTDLRMAGASGMELVEYLRKYMPAAKVFIITGDGTAEEMDRAFMLEVDGYLRKPFEVSHLRGLLEDRLSRTPGAA